MELSVARALNELKLLDERINRAISASDFVAIQIGNRNINDKTPVKSFEERAKASLQSVKALVARRNQIKSKIVESNAKTVAKIGNKEMTIAEIIERKGSISYDKFLLQRMRNQNEQVSTTVIRENNNVRARLDEHIRVVLGKETKDKQNEIDVISKSFNELNEAKIIDPLDVVSEIDKLQTEIETFENEVDFILNESNVRTMIEIND